MDPALTEALTEAATDGMTARAALAALGVLTTIPVVLFALWGDYYGRYLLTLAEEDPLYDRAAESSRLNVAAGFAMIFQVVLFLASSEVRGAYPLVTFLIFLAAVAVQGWIQSSLERKIRPTHTVPTSTSLPATSPDADLRLALKAVFWYAVAGAAFIGIFLAFVQTSLWIGGALHLGTHAKNALALAASALGLMTGLGFNFAMGALHLRQVFPTRKLGAVESEIEAAALIRDCFARAQLPTPNLWMIELEGDRFANALVAGFSWGRGWLKPGLFVSKRLLADLTREELEAVVLHEVSHISLHHLFRRLLFSSSVILGILAAAIGMITVFGFLVHAGSGEAVAGFFGPLLSVLGFIAGTAALSRYNRKLELEADLHCVRNLGASFACLVTALRKLDGVNHASPTPRPSTSERRAQGSHPATEQRIARILAYLRAQGMKESEFAAILRAEEKQRPGSSESDESPPSKDKSDAA